MKRDELRIATPCGERWETMAPNGGGRLCATCDKVVHDLSTMSETRARRLLATKKDLCVRYLFDEHGNVWFAGDAPPLASRLLNRAKRGVAVAAALASPLALQACMGTMPAEDEVVPVAASASDAGHAIANPEVDSGDTGDGAVSNDADDAGSDAESDVTEDAGDGG